MTAITPTAQARPVAVVRDGKSEASVRRICRFGPSTPGPAQMVHSATATPQASALAVLMLLTSTASSSVTGSPRISAYGTNAIVTPTDFTRAAG
jgi:hypothetical protein